MKRIFTILTFSSALAVSTSISAGTENSVASVDPNLEQSAQSLQVLVQEAQAAGMTQEETLKLAAAAIENNTLTGQATLSKQNTQLVILTLLAAGLGVGATLLIQWMLGRSSDDKKTSKKNSSKKEDENNDNADSSVTELEIDGMEYYFGEDALWHLRDDVGSLVEDKDRLKEIACKQKIILAARNIKEITLFGSELKRNKHNKWVYKKNDKPLEKGAFAEAANDEALREATEALYIERCPEVEVEGRTFHRNKERKKWYHQDGHPASRKENKLIMEELKHIAGNKIETEPFSLLINILS